MTSGLSMGKENILCPGWGELQQSRTVTTGCYNVQDISTDHIYQRSLCEMYKLLKLGY